MHPTEAALRRGVSAAPHDDVPRLVLSDWFEENGQEERGEFIRLQCRLAEMSDEDPDYATISRREQKLLRKNQSNWLKEVPWTVRRTNGFIRGFPRGSERGSLNAFLKTAAETELTIPSWSVTLDAIGILSTWPDWPCELCRIESLALNTMSSRHDRLAAVRLLLGCPELTNVRRLRLTFYEERFLGDWLRGLNREQLPRLGDLELSGLIDRALIETLTESDVWENLTALSLMSARLRADGIDAIVSAGVPLAMSRLNLSNSWVGDEGLERLLEWSGIERLQSLSLGSTGLTDVSAFALSLSPDLEGLRTLDLSGNMINSPGARALAVSPSLSSVRRLDLRNNPLERNDDTVRALQVRFGDMLLVRE